MRSYDASGMSGVRSDVHLLQRAVQHVVDKSYISQNLTTP